VLPEEETRDQSKETSLDDFKQKYFEALKQEIYTSSLVSRLSSLKTIYIWWWTPYQLWEERLIELLHYIHTSFDLSDLQECTIEINPDPLDRVPVFMKRVEEECFFLKGLRRSIGTQSFDDSLLSASKRAYNFVQLKDFFQTLSLQKSSLIRYNLDLIAFGKLFDGIPRGQEQVDWFQDILEQKLFDSISLYTLELFPGSDWYHQSHHTSKAVQMVYGDDDKIFEEFLWLRSCIYTYWYTRQELSNFALEGKGSFHNDVYWSMQSYLGLGINASSYLAHEDAKEYFWDIYAGEYGVRFQNTKQRKKYLSIKSKSESRKSEQYESFEQLTREQYLKDAFFLGLRKGKGIVWVSHVEEILITDWKQEVVFLESIGKLAYDEKNDSVKLEDAWFDVYNSVVGILMK
jgi:oxygen-independent coproporphyrinogen III oxidase